MAKNERDKTVQFISVRDTRETLSKVLDAAQGMPHVVIKHGKPAAVIIGVEGRDIEDLIREYGEKKTGKK